MITKIAEGRKEDIDIAVKAARVAFDDGPWPRMPGAVRYHFSSSSFSKATKNCYVALSYHYYYVGLIYLITCVV